MHWHASSACAYGQAPLQELEEVSGCRAAFQHLFHITGKDLMC